MGCCLSRKDSSSSSPPSLSLNNGGPSSSCSSSVKPTNPIKTTVEIHKPEAEPPTKTCPGDEHEKPRSENELQEGEPHENGKVKKEVFVIKHRKSHDRLKTTEPSVSPASAAAEEKSTDSNPNPAAGVVRTSSCTKEEVDAILIQCGRLSRSNSAAGKTRRYSGSKRSFDFDQNERSRDGDAEEGDAEDAGEEEGQRRMHRQRHRGGDRCSASPRERRRRTPSREREDSKSYRSGSRERGNGGGGRRVSRSPGRRSETNPNPNSCGGSGNSVNSGNNRPGKLVSVPATDKNSLAMDKSNNGEPSVKRITVKRNVGEAHRTVASPRSQSPARAAANAGNNAQPPPSLSRSSSRKAEHSPYRRNPLAEIDTNSLAHPQSRGDKMGSGNGNCNKKMINRENEGQGLIKESGNFMGQKPNLGMNTSNNRVTPQAANCRAASPNRVARERQETAEECKITSLAAEPPKSHTISRSRSLRKSRDFDFSPEALLSNNNAAAPGQSSYTALLLEDIQNFHQKKVNSNVDMSFPSSFALPQCVTKACSIVDAVADLNSTTNTSPVPDHQHQRNEFNFSSCANKADLMEPSFEKYVTVKRGGSLEDLEEQESSGSNSFTGSSGFLQQQGFSSTSWEPNSADSTDRWSSKSSKIKERDQSPLGFQRNDANCQKQEFDPLKNGIVRRKVAANTSSGKGVVQTTRVAAAST